MANTRGKSPLRRVNAAWLSRSERRAYAYSTLRLPTFSGDSLTSAVWLTVRPNGADHQWKEDPPTAGGPARKCYGWPVTTPTQDIAHVLAARFEAGRHRVSEVRAIEGYPERG